MFWVMQKPWSWTAVCLKIGYPSVHPYSEGPVLQDHYLKGRGFIRVPASGRPWTSISSCFVPGSCPNLHESLRERPLLTSKDCWHHCHTTLSQLGSHQVRLGNHHNQYLTTITTVLLLVSESHCACEHLYPQNDATRPAFNPSKPVTTQPRNPVNWTAKKPHVFTTRVAAGTTDAWPVLWFCHIW